MGNSLSVGLEGQNLFASTCIVYNYSRCQCFICIFLNNCNYYAFYQLSETLLINLSRLMPKPTKLHVGPAKTQISLGIRPVWSETSLSAWRNLGSLAIHSAYSEDSDQSGRIPRLIWVFAGRTCHFVGFVMRRLLYCPESLLPDRIPTDRLPNEYKTSTVTT